MEAGEKIKAKIEELRKEKLSIIGEGRWVLDPRLPLIESLIEGLIRSCPHQVNEDNICIWCGTEVEE